jgi:hypothetical protein
MMAQIKSRENDGKKLLLTNICVNSKRIDGKNTPALEIFALSRFNRNKTLPVNCKLGDRACRAVVIALRFGTQGLGFEPNLLHKACYMPLHGY